MPWPRRPPSAASSPSLLVLSLLLARLREKKGGEIMTYTKPQMVSLPNAMSVIQAVPLIKGVAVAFDSQSFFLVTICAYEADE